MEEEAKLVVASREIHKPGETEAHEIGDEAGNAARRIHRALNSRMAESVLVPRLHTGPKILKRQLELRAQRKPVRDFPRVAELHLVDVLSELRLEVRAPRVLPVEDILTGRVAE